MTDDKVKDIQRIIQLLDDYIGVYGNTSALDQAANYLAGYLDEISVTVSSVELVMTYRVNVSHNPDEKYFNIEEAAKSFLFGQRLEDYESYEAMIVDTDKDLWADTEV